MTVKGSKITPMRITPHNPSAKIVRILVLLLVFIACAVASYFAGFYQINRQQAAQTHQQETQQQKATNELSQELAQLRTSVDIDRQTIEVGHFNYSLMVQKLSTKDADFSGFLEFRIIGQQGGKSLQLSLYQVSSQVTVPSIPLSFKYFQTLEGDLTLPIGFVPQTVELVVKSKDKKSSPLVSVELDWPTADFKLK